MNITCYWLNTSDSCLMYRYTALLYYTIKVEITLESVLLFIAIQNIYYNILLWNGSKNEFNFLKRVLGKWLYNKYIFLFVKYVKYIPAGNWLNHRCEYILYFTRYFIRTKYIGTYTYYTIYTIIYLIIMLFIYILNTWVII